MNIERFSAKPPKWVTVDEETSLPDGGAFDKQHAESRNESR